MDEIKYDDPSSDSENEKSNEAVFPTEFLDKKEITSNEETESGIIKDIRVNLSRAGNQSMFFSSSSSEAVSSAQFNQLKDSALTAVATTESQRHRPGSTNSYYEAGSWHSPGIRKAEE